MTDSIKTDVAPTAEQTKAAQQPSGFGADGKLSYADVYGGGSRPAPQAEAPAAKQHTGDEYSKRYGSYRIPTPGQ